LLLLLLLSLLLMMMLMLLCWLILWCSCIIVGARCATVVTAGSVSLCACACVRAFCQCFMCARGVCGLVCVYVYACVLWISTSLPAYVFVRMHASASVCISLFSVGVLCVRAVCASKILCVDSLISCNYVPVNLSKMHYCCLRELTPCSSGPLDAPARLQSDARNSL
jgi:hypothetical protein